MRTIFTLFFCLVFCKIYAQEELKIEYEFRNEFDFENASDAKSKERLKNSNENRLYFELITSKEESIYNKIDRVDNSQNRSGVSISFVSGPGGLYYKNLKENYSLSEINYNGKNLLIKDTINHQKWIIKKESTKIAGFDVKKAFLQESENVTVEAWYAPKLNFRNGPSNYEGLPGVILKIIIHNKEGKQLNKQIYLATKVELSEKSKITQPTKGKLISQLDFEKLIEEDNQKINELFLQK